MSCKAMLLILVCSFSFLQITCKKDPPVVPPIEPPPYQQSIFLSIADSGLTEVYLSLSMTDTLPPREFEVFRNNSKVLSGSLFDKETTLVDMTAQMNTSYTYQAFRVDNALRTDSSAVVATKTLDTTSHVFVFEIDTLGDGASQLFDVAIINDTLIYAVGQIYLKDSVGNWINPPYNLAKWDGNKWELKQLYYGTNSFLSSIRGILWLNTNEVYLAAGGVFKWNEQTNQVQLFFSRLSLPDPNATIEKLWGTHGDIYGVGYAGTIVYYNGSSWKKIESGTTVSINDVWGGKDRQGNKFVIVGATNIAAQGERKLIQVYQGMPAENLNWSPQQQIMTIWFSSWHNFYVGGGKVYKGLPNNWKEIAWPKYFANRIRGTGENNIWITGAFGFCGHFNGSTWQEYSQTYLPNGTYYGLSVTHNMIVAVGQVGDKAVILRGRKNN